MSLSAEEMLGYLPAEDCVSATDPCCSVAAEEPLSRSDRIKPLASPTVTRDQPLASFESSSTIVPTGRVLIILNEVEGPLRRFIRAVVLTAEIAVADDESSRSRSDRIKPLVSPTITRDQPFDSFESISTIVPTGRVLIMLNEVEGPLRRLIRSDVLTVEITKTDDEPLV